MLKKRVPVIFHGENPEIVNMQQRMTTEQYEQLEQLSNVEPRGMINASFNFSEGRMEEKGELDHLIGVATTLQTEHEEFSIVEVRAGEWAVFESEGPFPEALQDTWGRIYSEWFPTSVYEAVDGPEILWIENSDLDKPEVKSEIWMPVKKRHP